MAYVQLIRQLNFWQNLVAMRISLNAFSSSCFCRFSLPVLPTLDMNGMNFRADNFGSAGKRLGMGVDTVSI